MKTTKIFFFLFFLWVCHLHHELLQYSYDMFPLFGAKSFHSIHSETRFKPRFYQLWCLLIYILYLHSNIMSLLSCMINEERDHRFLEKLKHVITILSHKICEEWKREKWIITSSLKWLRSSCYDIAIITLMFRYARE